MSDTAVVYNLLARDQVSPTLGKVGGSFASLGSRIKGLAAGLVGAFAGMQAVQFLGDAVSEFRDAEKVGRLTEQVIKSTGQAAGITGDHVSDLAERLSGLSGVDDDLIQSGENVLLTFTNIRNGVGKGNDIFDQATGLALDMSKALGTDLKGASMQLGKALNDPERGMNALRRAGVSFSDAQRDQIKAMVASGDRMGAQKIMLAELTKEFGGAAAAMADPADKAQVAWGNFQEMLGGLVFPLVAKFSDLLTSQIIPGVQAAIAAFKDPDVTSDGFVGAMQRVGILARQVWEIFRTKLWPAIVQVGQAISQFVGWIHGGSAGAQMFTAAVVALTAAFIAWKVAVTAISLVTKIATAVQIAWNIAMYANPIGLIILAIVALVAAFVYLWNNNEGFRKFFINMWNHIWGFLKSIGAWFAGPFVNFFKKAWSFLSGLVVGYFNLYINTWKKIFSFIGAIPGKIRSLARGMWNGLIDSFRGVINAIIGAWNSLDFGIHVHLPAALGGFGFDVDDVVPDIPYLAKGGIVTGPTLAVLGENGKERVEPLTGPYANGGGSRQPVHFHLHVNGREVRRWLIDDATQRNVPTSVIQAAYP